jgi:hypothetical protein
MRHVHEHGCLEMPPEAHAPRAEHDRSGRHQPPRSWPNSLRSGPGQEKKSTTEDPAMPAACPHAWGKLPSREA